MTEPITWISKTIKLGDLKDYEHNPRRMSKKDFERLVNGIKQDGYHNRIRITTDNIILGGHSRRKALLSSGYSESSEIEVLCCSRDLNEKEFMRLIIRDNLPFGEYDFDILANHFDPSELIEWGMQESYFEVTEDKEPIIESKVDSLPGNVCLTCPYKEKNNELKKLILNKKIYSTGRCQ